MTNVVCDIEMTIEYHRNSGFNQLENDGSFHGYVNVYQRVENAQSFSQLMWETQ